MPRITRKSKITAYHPVTGLYLEAGQSYEIDGKHFSPEVFEGDAPVEEEEPDPPAEAAPGETSAEQLAPVEDSAQHDKGGGEQWA